EGSRVGLMVMRSSPFGHVPARQTTPLPAAIPAGGSTMMKLCDATACHEVSPLPVLRMRTVVDAVCVGSFTFTVMRCESAVKPGCPSNWVRTFAGNVGAVTRLD